MSVFPYCADDCKEGVMLATPSTACCSENTFGLQERTGSKQLAETPVTTCSSSPFSQEVEDALATPPPKLAARYRALFEQKTFQKSCWFFGRRSRGRYEYGDELGRGTFGVVSAAKLCGRLPPRLAELRQDQLDQAQLGWLDKLNEKFTSAKEHSRSSVGPSIFRGKNVFTQEPEPFPFACKVLSKTSDPLRVKIEMQLLELCQGPRVLLLIENIATKNNYHIITNRCYGTVEQRIFEDISPAWIAAPRARKWSAQLLRAVVHIHAQGVIHRDVKPANVFCMSPSPCSDVVLGDFGLATKCDRPGLSVSSAGSWGYWDVRAFDGYMTQYSDLWAVGLSALELSSNIKLVRQTKKRYVLEAQNAARARVSCANGDKPLDAKTYYRDELRRGIAVKEVEKCCLYDAGMRVFLNAVLSVEKRPAGSELVALLPDRAVAGTGECSA